MRTVAGLLTACALGIVCASPTWADETRAQATALRSAVPKVALVAVASQQVDAAQRLSARDPLDEPLPPGYDQRHALRPADIDLDAPLPPGYIPVRAPVRLDANDAPVRGAAGPRHGRS